MRWRCTGRRCRRSERHCGGRAASGKIQCLPHSAVNHFARPQRARPVSRCQASFMLQPVPGAEVGSGDFSAIWAIVASCSCSAWPSLRASGAIGSQCCNAFRARRQRLPRAQVCRSPLAAGRLHPRSAVGAIWFARRAYAWRSVLWRGPMPLVFASQGDGLLMRASSGRCARPAVRSAHRASGAEGDAPARAASRLASSSLAPPPASGPAQ
jgi:hypothetical protein